MSAPALTITDLTAGYRRHPVLRGLSLSPFAPGTVTALVGPNGAGKSTLLKVLAGLLPAAGSITLGGLDLLRAPLAERARHVTFMPQTLPQRVGLSVLEGVISALRASPLAPARAGEAGGAGTTADRAAMATLERIGIRDLALEPLDHLSGGERQLASLAQAVVRHPALLLLDEPTSALDLRHQVTVMRLVEDLAAEGRIVVVVLHDLNLAVRWAGRVVVLNHGLPDADGPPLATITPEVLARVYGVQARLESASNGRPQVVVDGLIEATGAARP